MTYAEQQIAINRAIADLRSVADTISSPYLEEDIRKAIKTIQHLSDEEMQHVGSPIRF